jgi:hypothetical protein
VGIAGDDPIRALLGALPPTVWYLTSTGTDMWCRRPYGFFFSSREAADAFARSMGTGFELTSIGVDATALLSEDALSGMRRQQITRIFVDPRLDEATGDVHGTILRLEEVH